MVSFNFIVQTTRSCHECEFNFLLMSKNCDWIRLLSLDMCDYFLVVFGNNFFPVPLILKSKMINTTYE